MSRFWHFFDRPGRQLVVSPSAKESTFGQSVHNDAIDPKETEHFWLEAAGCLHQALIRARRLSR